jgi:hypothetical protein
MAATTHLVLYPYYIYDPNVPDTLGGLQVKENDKGKFVLATSQMVQYWVDQGLLGEKPVGEISDAHKKLLKQVTRGRSEDNDKDPKRLPKYSKSQSGAPAYALQPSAVQRKKIKARKEKSESKPAAAATRPPAATPTSAPLANPRATS